MKLDVLPLPPDILFQLASRGIEGIPNRDIDVFVKWIVLGRFLHDGDLFARHLDVESHLIDIALKMVAMGHIDDHPAAHNAIAELVELRGLLEDPIFDGFDALEIVKADLQWKFHLSASACERALAFCE